MAQFQLVLRVGPSPGKVFPLLKNDISIGRDINNEIVINDAEISRKHCRLNLVGNGYIIEDLGSTNGTWVDEQRISQQYQLKQGNTIRLGDNITLNYEVVGHDADATIASANAVPSTVQPGQPQQQYQQPAPQYQQAPRKSQGQQYSGRVPAASPAPKIFGINRGLAIGLAALAVVSICLIAFLVYVDSNCLWCEISWDLLPGCPYTATCP